MPSTAKTEVGSRGCADVYSTSDVTQLPFSIILRGGGFEWPLNLRVRFAFRKALGWHYAAPHGRTEPRQWRPIEVAALPASLRDGFLVGIQEAEEHGFKSVGICKSDTIGSMVSYCSILISDDRTTQWSLTALRTAVGTMSRSAWITGLRTDLSDRTIFITGRGPTIQPFLSRPHQRLEIVPEPTPTPEVVRRHRERIRSLLPQQIVLVPAEGLGDFLIRQAQTDFRDWLSGGMTRRLTESETIRLSQISFDFE